MTHAHPHNNPTSDCAHLTTPSCSSHTSQPVDLPTLLSHWQPIHKADAKTKMATMVVAMLGSNLNPSDHLGLAHAHLSSLGWCHYLPMIRSRDYTGLADDYDNQAVIIDLAHKTSLAEVFDFFAQLERSAGRRTGKMVSLDVDVLAFCDVSHCHTIAERLPLKAHEIACLSAV